MRNDQLIVVDFYLGNYEMPLSLALAIALLGGAILGVLSGLPSWLKLKSEKARTRQATQGNANLIPRLLKNNPQINDSSADDFIYPQMTQINADIYT